MKKKIINITIWIISVIVFINSIWLFSYILSSLFNLDSLIPKDKNFYYIFFSSSFIIVFLATLLNISLNLSIIAERKIDAVNQSNNQILNKHNLIYTVAIIVFLAAFIFSLDFYKRNKERKLILNRWTYVIHEYSGQIDKISESICDTSKMKGLPEILKDFASHRIENPYMTIIGYDTIKNQPEFIEIASNFSEDDFYKAFTKPIIYKCFGDELDYLKKTFTTKSTDIYLWTEKGSFRFFYPVDKGKRKYILLFNYIDNSHYRFDH